MELSRLEAAHVPARVGERKQQPTVEVVVAAAVRKPGREQLVAFEALLRGTSRERRPAGCVAEPELAAHLVPERARRQVLAHEGGLVAVPEQTLVERRRTLEELAEPLLLAPGAIRLRGDLLVLDLDAEALGEMLDRADEVDVLELLDEADRVAALAASEALEGAASRRDREARSSLLVKGAEALVRPAGLAEADVVLDEREDLRRRLHRIDRAVLDAGHQASCSAKESAKRSVMPAR